MGAGNRGAASTEDALRAAAFETNVARRGEFAGAVGALRRFRRRDADAGERGLVRPVGRGLRPGGEEHADKRHREHQHSNESAQLEP